MDLGTLAPGARRLLLGSLLLALALPGQAVAEAYVTLSESDCSQLARYYPSDDVTYQPGRDVNGEPVVPADLDGGQGLILPDTVVIPIEVDLFHRFGIPANRANFKGDIFVGEVTVDVATGDALFNGQPLQSEEAAELAARCQRIVRDKAKAGK